MKYLRIHDISIHISFYQNRFLNECVRKKKKCKCKNSYKYNVLWYKCKEIKMKENFTCFLEVSAAMPLPSQVKQFINYCMHLDIIPTSFRFFDSNKKTHSEIKSK